MVDLIGANILEKLLHLLNQNPVAQPSIREVNIDLEDEIISQTSSFPPAAEALEYPEEIEAHTETLAQENNWSD